MNEEIVQFLSILAQFATVLTGASIFFAMLQLSREFRVHNLQSLFYLHQYLSQIELGRSRKRVRTELFDKPYVHWSDEDKQAANSVCASYDQAGILLSAGILDNKTCRSFLSSSWGESICDQYEALKPFLDDKQTPSKIGREFFNHFSWLYRAASTYHRHPKEVKGF